MDSLDSKREWRQSKRVREGYWYLYDCSTNTIIAALYTTKKRWIGRRLTKSINRTMIAILFLTGYLFAILSILKFF